MKSKQFCSVCKEWLDMEVVSSGEAEEDDGVTWYRCPGCQGFLPKLNGPADEDVAAGATADSHAGKAAKPGSEASDNLQVQADEAMPWNSPGEMLDAEKETSTAEVSATMAGLDDHSQAQETISPVGEESSSDTPAETETTTVTKSTTEAESSADQEPLADYAVMLAEVDAEQAVPYRPWKTYEVGQCVLHLAWNDCGVVVEKESLPGGRRVIKCFFSEAGVVRLIENAAR